MTRFEDKLELELEAVVAENVAPAPKPARRRGFGWKPRIALVGAVAAAATAIALSGAVQPTNPAWAVEKTGDGTVRIKFKEFEDPEGLEKALAELGIRSELSFLPVGKRCSVNGDGKADPEQPITVEDDLGQHGSIELRYVPQRPDQTLVMRFYEGDGVKRAVTILSFKNVLGRVSPCDVVDGGPPIVTVLPK